MRFGLFIGASVLLAVFQGCTGDDPTASPASADGGPGANDATIGASDGGTPSDEAGEPDAAGDGEAAAPPVPTLRTVVDNLSDAIDFDVANDALVVLRTGPSRIDKCTRAGACSAFVPNDKMPGEQARDPLNPTPYWSNASVAFVESGTMSGYLVGQTGFDRCALNCDPPSDSTPGIYQVSDFRTAYRLTSALPGVTAKSSRTTNGILVGRGNRQALAQASGNEGPRSEHTTVYGIGFAIGGVASSTRTLLPRGYAGSGTIQPFAFAQTTTPAGIGGYAASDGALVDVSNTGVKLAVVPTLATVTTNDPGAAEAFARSASTPKNSVVTFHNTANPTLVTVPFAGADETTTALVGTERHVVAIGAPNAGTVSLAICTAEALVAKTCTPKTLSINLDEIVRVRSRESSLFILGKVGAKRTFFQVEIP